MQERTRLRFIQVKPNPEHAATITGRVFEHETAEQIATSLVSQNDGRNLRTIGPKIVNFSSEYFKGVHRLSPYLSQRHIQRVAQEIRDSRCVIFSKD